MFQAIIYVRKKCASKEDAEDTSTVESAVESLYDALPDDFRNRAARILGTPPALSVNGNGVH